MSNESTKAESASHRARAAFLERYGRRPEFEARAPGRVNLIGDHTDYNDGFAMPIAVQFDTVIVASPRAGSCVEIHSEGFGSAEFDTTRDPLETEGWPRYLHAMCSLVDGSGTAQGWVGCITSDIPIGAGLSASAALEVATGLLASRLVGRRTTALDLAKLGQRVENYYLGLPSGVMDQLASCNSRAGHATLIDCRDLSTSAIPIPADAAVVVMDTGTRRQLIQSEYADRKSECGSAAQALGVETLRTINFVHQLSNLNVGSTLWRRAHHVVSENNRTLEAAETMRWGDATALGSLMFASHASLRDDYDVSSRSLDLMVEIATDAPGCLGARMTGGGFAGCAVALVTLELADQFCEQVTSQYRAATDQKSAPDAKLFVVDASDGASVRRLS